MIQNKEYNPGDYLPSEIELAHQYQVSRETIRKAHNLLSQEGYISKQQGRGTVVLDVHRFKISGSSLEGFNELQKGQNFSIDETLILKNKIEKISKERLLKFTVLEKDITVLTLERLRKIGGENVILDIDYFKVEIISEIPDENAKESIFKYVEQVTKQSIGFAHKEITVEKVTETDKILLDIGSDTHVVVIRSKVFLDDATLFQFHESRHRVDTFKLIDFARRM